MLQTTLFAKFIPELIFFQLVFFNVECYIYSLIKTESFIDYHCIY